VSSLTARDTEANNMLNAFNFTTPPRAPQPIPLSADELSTLTAIILTPSSGHPGDTIKMIGNGFTFNETGVQVKFDGKVVVSGIHTNGTGSFQTTFTVPLTATKIGPHNVSDLGLYNVGVNTTFNIIKK
jgi:hypothetical protein